MNPNVIDFGITNIPSASTDTVNISTFMLEVRNRLSRLESAYTEITQLKAALAESELARTTLQAQLDRVSQPINTESATTSPVTPPAPSRIATTTNVPHTPPKPTSSDPLKKRKKPAATPSKSKASATIGRLFAPKIAGSPSGFTYVYFTQQARRPLEELRSSFKGIGLNNARVLDIQYPLPNVVSFFLHRDYVLQFTTAMHKSGRGCSPLMDFDPCDPKHLLDPKFASLPQDLKAQKAVSIENTRCLRSLAFVRRSVRLSVARSFLHYDRINQAQFDAILAEELAARTSSSPSKSSEKERQTKRRRLLFLGYLLTHDADTAKILAYTESPPPSPITTASKDASMADIPAL